MEPLDNNTDITITNCKHLFHSSCLTKWLTQNMTYHGSTGSCPICRSFCYDDSDFNKKPTMIDIIKNTFYRAFMIR